MYATVEISTSDKAELLAVTASNAADVVRLIAGALEF